MTATYGDLVGQAGADIHLGLLAVMRRGFTDPAHAANTVGAYYDLLTALRAHTWRLIDPQHARTSELLQAASHGAQDNVEVVAVRLFAAIGPINDRPTWLPYPPPEFDHPWRDAADKLGAATDLLATHVGPHGQDLSEQAAQVLDPRNRHGALVAIAELTDLVLNAETAIGAACRHRDIPWDTVHRWLPGTDHLRPLVHRLHDLAATDNTGPGLRDIPVNVHPVREGDPMLELGDRMLRLRHAAWRLASGRPDYSVVTLRDLAGLGMATHAHTAAAHGVDLSAPGSSPNRLLTNARAFQHLANDLHDYLAPGPPDPDIRADILAARQLLADIAPLDRPARLLRLADPTTRATLAVLHGACEVMGQIARMNQATFTDLARSEQIHIPTRLLTGELLTDDPQTAAAKLSGTPRVLAPTARVRRTLDAYEAVGTAAAPIQAYQPAAISAGAYPPPAVFRSEEFEGRP